MHLPRPHRCPPTHLSCPHPTLALALAPTPALTQPLPSPKPTLTRYPDIESMVLHGWRWRSENYGTPPAPSVDPLMHNGRACTTRGCTETNEHVGAMVRSTL